MNTSNYRFSLDVQSNVSQASLPVRLLDTGRRLYIGLTDGGTPYIIEDGCRAVFFARKADGHTIMNDCIIDRSTVIRYDLTEQTTSCAGVVDCEIRLYGIDDNLITSPRFIMVVSDRVVHSDDIPISESEKDALDGILASEAKRVGAELARESAERDRVSSMSNIEERANGAIATAEEAAEIATEAAEKVNMEQIVQNVLDVLPSWEGGSY